MKWFIGFEEPAGADSFLVHWWQRSFMELHDEFVPWNAVTGAMDLVKQLVPGLGQVGDLTPVFSSWLSENARSESQIWRQPAFMFLFRPFRPCSRTTCNWQTTPEPARLLL